MDAVKVMATANRIPGSAGMTGEMEVARAGVMKSVNGILACQGNDGFSSIRV
jgi:hypothetical protein